MTWVIYEDATGKLLSTYTGPEEFLAANTPVDYSSIEGTIDESIQYVDINETPPAIVNKLEMSLTINKVSFNADLVDSVMVSGLPIPVDVIWPVDTEGTITDGVAEFFTNTPGQYQLVFSSIDYLEEIVNVTAEALQ